MLEATRHARAMRDSERKLYSGRKFSPVTFARVRAVGSLIKSAYGCVAPIQSASWTVNVREGERIGYCVHRRTASEIIRSIGAT